MNYKNQDIGIAILLFCFTIFVSVTITSPAIFMNDEWIPLNQLSQIYNGQQLIFNEERYGKSFTGELSGYFSVRENVLGYSLTLPLLSIPCMMVFLTLGDLSRLLIILIWWLALIGPLLYIGVHHYPKHCIVRKTAYWIGLSVALILLLVNLSLYTPFQMNLPLRPVEVPSIIFTQQILLGLMASIIFFTYRFLFNNRSFCFTATLITICSSSYFFWASSAKDHLLIAFLLSCIFLSVAGFLATNFNRYLVLTFLFSGLITWGRPEIGAIIFCATLFFFIILFIRDSCNQNNYFARKVISIGLGSILGIIPFLFNNKIITGNFFIPPQYLYIDRDYASKFTHVLEINTNISPSKVNLISESSGSVSFSKLVDKLISFIMPSGNNLFESFFGILTITAGKAAGLLYITPLILPGLFLFLGEIYTKRSNLNKKQKHFFVFSGFLSLVILFGYIRGFQGLNISLGILPDVRYLSPIYLPFSFISLIIIGSLFGSQFITLLRYLIYSLLVVPPVLILSLLIFQPFDGGYIGSVSAIGLLIFFMMGIVTILLIFSFFGTISNKWALLPIAILTALPFTWQIWMTFIFSFVRMNGYPLWIPIVEKLYDLFLLPIY